MNPLQRNIEALEQCPEIKEEEEEDEVEPAGDGVGEGYGDGLICQSVRCPHCGGYLSVSMTAY
eukprot:COSAG01_NODE_43_length_32320_cov_622.744763_2_plen_63_part_00